MCTDGVPLGIPRLDYGIVNLKLIIGVGESGNNVHASGRVINLLYK